MNKASVLIVDDEKSTREGLARALRGHFDVRMAEGGTAALRLLAETPADLVLSDVRMPDMDGMTLMRRIFAQDPRPVVILMTAYGNIETAVEAMKEGAYDFLTKPVSLDRLDILIRRALDQRHMEAENRRLRERLDQRYGLENITGESLPMQEVFDVIRQVAPTRATVMIQGESGTGKELVAQALHQLGPRSKGPFVAVHCAALSSSLLESELFGHERGAFTGARERHMGRFERADGGTLFLDEIGEIDPSVQVKILRVLEEHRFERVGGQQTIEVDVRLIVATNRNLEDMVRQGSFREDLFYRLNVVTISLPPLRDRPGDIPLLANRFLRELTEQNHRPSLTLTPEVMETLCAHPWPGNVRELRNVIERMVVLSRGDRLTLREVPPAIRSAAAPPVAARAAGRTIEDMEREMIRRTLESNGNNRALAAEQLGISRRTLHRKLNEFGLHAVSPGRRGRRPRSPGA